MSFLTPLWPLDIIFELEFPLEKNVDKKIFSCYESDKYDG